VACAETKEMIPDKKKRDYARREEVIFSKERLEYAETKDV
jgi:hypothetical protein